jgi:C-methyltransferase
VLIIEGILPEHLDPGSLSIDVIMLAVTGGRERTADELGNLLGAAGLQLARVIDTPGRLRIAEAHLTRPVGDDRIGISPNSTPRAGVLAT